jgi:hypothetical protein
MPVIRAGSTPWRTNASIITSDAARAVATGRAARSMSAAKDGAKIPQRTRWKPQPYLVIIDAVET